MTLAAVLSDADIALGDLHLAHQRRARALQRRDQLAAQIEQADALLHNIADELARHAATLDDLALVRQQQADADEAIPVLEVPPELLAAVAERERVVLHRIAVEKSRAKLVDEHREACGDVSSIDDEIERHAIQVLAADAKALVSEIFAVEVKAARLRRHLYAYAGMKDSSGQWLPANADLMATLRDPPVNADRNMSHLEETRALRDRFETLKRGEP